MIKSKKCSLCDKPVFSRGLCQQHSNSKKLESKNISIKYTKNTIKRVKETTVEKKQVKRQLREGYFNHHLERCSHSELTGLPIEEPTRSNICHILPKGTHSSLQDNLDNFIYLTFKEHERFDYLLFSLKFAEIEKEFKNILELIRIRSNKFIHLCQENTNLKREFEKWIQTLK